MAWLLSFAFGCQGNLLSPSNPDGASGGGGGDGGGNPDGQAFSVAGTLRDYDEREPVANLTIATSGLDPALTVVSGSDGAFVLGEVPAASAFYVSVSGTGGGYRATVNPTLTVIDQDMTIELLVVTQQYANRLYTSTGHEPAPGTAIVIADLQDAAGAPLPGIDAAHLSLTDPGGAPVGTGPYFIGPVGNDIGIGQTATALDGAGRTRVVYLDVPAGSFMLTARLAGPPPGGDAGPLDAGLADAATDAALLDAGGDAGGGGSDAAAPTGATVVAPILTTDGGATLAVAAPPGSAPAPSGTSTFTADVYPILQRAAAGGAGCASCHRTGGVAGQILIFDDTAANVHAHIMASADKVVDLVNPSASLILTKPLYETPANHPNAFFLTTQDPRYVTMLAWIAAGAPL